MQSESTLIYKGQEILAIYSARLFDKAPSIGINLRIYLLLNELGSNQ